MFSCGINDIYFWCCLSLLGGKKKFGMEHTVGSCVNSIFEVYYFALSGQHANLASYSEVFFTIQDLFLYRTHDLYSVHGIHMCEQHAFENILQSPEILG